MLFSVLLTLNNCAAVDNIVLKTKQFSMYKIRNYICSTTNNGVLLNLTDIFKVHVHQYYVQFDLTLGILVAVFWSALVSCSRLYLGMHSVLVSTHLYPLPI